MSSENLPKKYGLIIPKQKSNIFTDKLKPSAFMDDDDEDDTPSQTDAGVKKLKPVIQQETKAKRHVQHQIEEALQQDPSVFEYDRVYDEIDQKRQEKSAEKKIQDKNREPKYIKQLLKAAERRQNEYDAREERKQVKEREKEQNEFDDKEVFVTAAYRKKMEELESYKEQEKRSDFIESVMDVTKQKDITGFYKHLLNDLAEPTKSSGQEAATNESAKIEKKEKSSTSKQYRTRDESSESDDGEPQIKQEMHSAQSDDETDEFPEVEKPKRKATIPKRSPTPEYRDSVTSKDRPISQTKIKDQKVLEKKEIKVEQESPNVTDSNQTAAANATVELEQKIISEREQSELLIKKRLDKLRQLLARQNDDAAVEQCRQRYLERKALRSQ